MTESEADYSLVLDSPLGRLGVRLQHEQICGVGFLPDSVSLATGSGAFAARIAGQFSAYFRDPRCSFRLPVALQGTPFQCRVWQALQRIPAGETRSYGELAELLGTGARAVGNACRHNPLPIIVPCHRVVAATGLGGYAGHTDAGRTLGRKHWLLEHEGVDTAGLKKRQPAPKR
jgi:methylated-DNA-[protein]-cysteine S-methyltransferase